MAVLKTVTRWIGVTSLVLFFGAGAVIVALGAAIDHNAAGHPAVWYTGTVGFCGMVLWVGLRAVQMIADLRRSSRRMQQALEGRGSLSRLAIGQEERANSGLLLLFFAGLALGFCALFAAFAEGRTGFLVAAGLLLVAGLAMLWRSLVQISTFRKVRAAQRELGVMDERELRQMFTDANATGTAQGPLGPSEFR